MSDMKLMLSYFNKHELTMLAPCTMGIQVN
jgi:hypothetical protein